MSDFSDRTLVAGSVVGVRSFAVDSLGRLTGATVSSVWRPGINAARCLRVNPDGAAPPERGPTRSQHTIGNLGCTCGYYAYTDTNANPHHRSSSNLLGIVEGTGVTTVGTRGFRSAKARILALVIPGSERPREWWPRLSLWAFRHDVPAFFGAAALVATGGIGGPVLAKTTHNPWSLLLLILAAVGILLIVACYVGIDYYYECRSALGPDPDRLEMVRRNYPDVPTFHTLKAALEQFPLSTAPEPPAPTPDDPDFWTRSAP